MCPRTQNGRTLSELWRYEKPLLKEFISLTSICCLFSRENNLPSICFTVWIPCGAPGSPWMLVTLVNLEWNMWASQAERTGCQGYGANTVRHSAFIIPISFMCMSLWTHSDSNHITGAKTTRRCPQKNDLMWITALKLALKKSCDRVTFICSFSLAVTLRLHPCGRNQGNRKLKEVLNL